MCESRAARVRVLRAGEKERGTDQDDQPSGGSLECGAPLSYAWVPASRRLPAVAAMAVEEQGIAGEGGGSG
jgi:hypothetical protein